MLTGLPLTQPLHEIVEILGSHGCPDVTQELDINQSSTRPIAFGGFGDIYRGKLNTGITVAIKCARFNEDENISRRSLKVRTVRRMRFLVIKISFAACSSRTVCMGKVQASQCRRPHRTCPISRTAIYDITLDAKRHFTTISIQKPRCQPTPTGETCFSFIFSSGLTIQPISAFKLRMDWHTSTG
jgi:hypothetical protein